MRGPRTYLYQTGANPKINVRILTDTTVFRNRSPKVREVIEDNPTAETLTATFRSSVLAAAFSRIVLSGAEAATVRGASGCSSWFGSTPNVEEMDARGAASTDC